MTSSTRTRGRRPREGAPRTRRGRRSAALGGLLAVLAAGLVSLAAAPVDDDELEVDRVGDARGALESWVENRRLIAKEKRDWALGRQLLEERIEIVRAEIESLRGRIGEAQGSIAEADEKRVALVEKKDGLERASSTLGGTVTALETRTRTLLQRLPEPLIERVRPISQRIPEDPAGTKLSLSERFATVVGVLNAINTFNREITLTSEVRSLPDGTSAEVTAVYLGIGQAYYASANGAAAGVGSGTPEGWVWTPADEHAADILAVIAILENEQPPAFVPLPLEIR